MADLIEVINAQTPRTLSAPWNTGIFTAPVNQLLDLWGSAPDDTVEILRVKFAPGKAPSTNNQQCCVTPSTPDTLTGSKPLKRCNDGLEYNAVLSGASSTLTIPAGSYVLRFSGSGFAASTTVLTAQNTQRKACDCECAPQAIGAPPPPPPPVTAQVIGLPCPLSGTFVWQGNQYTTPSFIGAVQSQVPGATYSGASCQFTAPAGSVFPPLVVSAVVVPPPAPQPTVYCASQPLLGGGFGYHISDPKDPAATVEIAPCRGDTSGTPTIWVYPTASAGATAPQYDCNGVLIGYGRNTSNCAIQCPCPENIKGDKGDTGAVGVGTQGPKGDAGLQGPKGDAGAQGIPGTPGGGAGGPAYTAGSGISISAGNVISNTIPAATPYTAGSGIAISGANVISTVGGGGGTGPSYVAGAGINISGNIISSTVSPGPTYTAGANVTISPGNVISAAGGGTGPTYTAGENIAITGNTISATVKTQSPLLGNGSTATPLGLEPLTFAQVIPGYTSSSSNSFYNSPDTYGTVNIPASFHKGQPVLLEVSYMIGVGDDAFTSNTSPTANFPAGMRLLTVIKVNGTNFAGVSQPALDTPLQTLAVGNNAAPVAGINQGIRQSVRDVVTAAGNIAVSVGFDTVEPAPWTGSFLHRMIVVSATRLAY